MCTCVTFRNGTGCANITEWKVVECADELHVVMVQCAKVSFNKVNKVQNVR